MLPAQPQDPHRFLRQGDDKSNNHVVNSPAWSTWASLNKLQVKASLIILMIVGGAVLTTEWLHTSYVDELLKDAIDSKALVLMQQIESRFQTEQDLQVPSRRDTYLEELLERNPDLLRVQIYGIPDIPGHAPPLLGQKGKGEPSSDEISTLILMSISTAETRGGFQSQAGNDRLALSIPLTIEERFIGVLYAEYWTGHLEPITRSFLNWSFLIRVFMGIGIIAALNLFLYIHVVRPLGRLKQGLTELEQGNWATVIPSKKVDEIGDLSRAFNSMAQKIQCIMKENTALNQALLQARDTLQGKVAEATSELRARNEELAALNERLSAAQRDILRQQRLAVLGQLVATVAHKIGTPLTAISGHLQLLQEEPRLSPEIAERVQTMLKQTDRLNHSIQDLLTFTRTPSLTFEPVSLANLLGQCILLFKPLFQEHGIQLSTCFAPDLHPVQGDPFHLQEAINNLIDNAIDAMPNGGTLTLEAQNEPNPTQSLSEVVLTVKDTGHGIPHEQKEKIFQPFFTTKILGAGTGLGLAITTEIIQLHKGSLSVISVEGQGTTFTLRLPVWKGNEYDPRQNSYCR
jgi:two-component system, NtrC family, sensor kinase